MCDRDNRQITICVVTFSSLPLCPRYLWCVYRVLCVHVCSCRGCLRSALVLQETRLDARAVGVPGPSLRPSGARRRPAPAHHAAAFRDRCLPTCAGPPETTHTPGLTSHRHTPNKHNLNTPTAGMKPKAHHGFLNCRLPLTTYIKGTHHAFRVLGGEGDLFVLWGRGYSRGVGASVLIG